MRKIIIIIFFLLSFAGAAEFSNKIPTELRQLVESFDCFSKDDKMMLYSYILALKYRMENVDNKEALVKSDLDYWRLWHIVSDIEDSYELDYKFDDIMEETITPTKEERNILKKLRRVEGAIHTDGSSVISEKMRKYDDDLRAKIIANPPKYEIVPKNKLLNDYDLKVLKKYIPNSIPKNIYDSIEEKNVTGIKKDVLLNYAVLTESLIHNYDQPEKRHKLQQEAIYLEQCLKYYGLGLRHDFYHNFTRKLAQRSISHDIYGRFKTDFLPKEVHDYCENNITAINVTPFQPKADKVIPKENTKVTARLETLTAYLKKYDGDKEKKKYADQYLALMKSELEKSSTPTPSLESLKLLRLKNCIVGNDDKEDFALILARVKDFRLEGLKETFYSNILNSQRWWRTTIHMKIKAEGESQELKHFFDCNATTMDISQKLTADKKTQPRQSKPEKSYDSIFEQNREIFKYYAATFANTPTPDMNNKKAIESGIIPAKWVEANKTIKTLSAPLLIEGMPKGGVKLTYTGIPKGKACERITTMDIFPEIFFNGKTYDGLDYLLIDGHKLKYRHFNGEYAKRICAKQEMHTVSFVNEDTIVEKKYQPLAIDCQIDRYKKSKTIDTQRYAPNGMAVTADHRYFTLSGSKAALYNATIPSKVYDLPQELENGHFLAMDEIGEHIAMPQGRGFTLWNVPERKMITRLRYDHVHYEPFNVRKLAFIPGEIILVGVAQNGQSVRVLDPVNQKLIAEITPKFFEDKTEYRYRKPYIKTLSVSSDGKQLYIGGNQQNVEVWEITESLTYQYTIKLPKSPEVGVIKMDPLNPNHLFIAMRGEQLHLYDLKEKNIIKTYKADKYMDPNDIQFSDDGQYVMVTGANLFIWKIDSTVQFDIFSGDGIVGGLFKPFTYDVITVGRTVDVWEVKN